jgi:hypothetical protein
VTDPFRAYRPWFRAAVVYNMVWAAAVALYPRGFLQLAHMSDQAAPLAQCIAMMVGVYAYGYYLLARDPARYAPFIWIALAGKALGAAGFVAAAMSGSLPWRFGVVTLTNDLVWLPAFSAFALRHARHPS